LFAFDTRVIKLSAKGGMKGCEKGDNRIQFRRNTQIFDAMSAALGLNGTKWD